MKKIIGHPLFVWAVGALATNFLPDIIKKHGGTSMEFLYKYFWSGIWPIWCGLAIAVIYWFIIFSRKVYKTYNNYERDKKAMVDKINLYQNGVISLGNQFTKIDNRLHEMQQFKIESLEFYKFLQKYLGIFVIHSAQYGAEGFMKDVTEILRSKIVSDRIENFLVTNETLDASGPKDPIKKIRKILSVKYSYCGESLSREVPEGGTLSLPE